MSGVTVNIIFYLYVLLRFVILFLLLWVFVKGVISYGSPENCKEQDIDLLITHAPVSHSL